MQPEDERSPLKPAEASGRKKKRRSQRLATQAGKIKRTFGSPVKKLQTEKDTENAKTPTKLKELALKSLRKNQKIRKAPIKTQDTSKDLDQSRRELLDSNKNLDDYMLDNNASRAAIEPTPRTKPAHYPLEPTDQVIRFVANDHLIIIQPLAQR